MTKRILVIQGHPDASTRHFGHALAEAYVEAARRTGHEVEQVTIAELDFPLLPSREEWEHGALPPSLVPVQRAIERAEHLVFFFPLWLGGMPALLKGFLEQVMRPGFALDAGWKKKLSGRSARVVVTMGMPAVVYRWFFRAHSVKALERSILGFVGIAPVHETLIGMVEGSEAAHKAWLVKLARLGAKGN